MVINKRTNNGDKFSSNGRKIGCRCVSGHFNLQCIQPCTRVNKRVGKLMRVPWRSRGGVCEVVG